MPIILFLKDIKLFATQTKIELVLAAVNVMMIFDLQNALNLFERIIVYSCRTFKKSLHQNLTFMNTEIFQHIHWLAVLAGALGYFVLGAIWYTVLFGKQWRSYNASLMNTPDAKKGAGAIMFLSFIMMFVTAIGLSIIAEDRKSTRLNSSHPSISYAVFCLKKKIQLDYHSTQCFARSHSSPRLSSP